MAEWLKTALIDIVELIGGGTPKTSKAEYWGGNINWLSVKDFNNENRYVYSTEKTITEEGLNKFDGTRFITYYKNDLPHNNQGITGNELNRVYADSKRPIIWIATQRDGLNAYNYDEQTFTAYQHNPENPHSLITNDVTDISPSTQNDDGLWVSTL